MSRRDILTDIDAQIRKAPGAKAITKEIDAALRDRQVLEALETGISITTGLTVSTAANNHMDWWGNMLVISNGVTVTIDAGLPYGYIFYAKAVGQNAVVALPGGSSKTINFNKNAVKFIHTGNDVYAIEEPVDPVAGEATPAQRTITVSDTIDVGDNGKRLKLKITADIELTLLSTLGDNIFISVYNPTAFKGKIVKNAAHTLKKIDGTTIAADTEVYIKAGKTGFISSDASNTYVLEEKSLGDAWSYIEPTVGPDAILGTKQIRRYTRASYSAGTWTDELGNGNLTNTDGATTYGAPTTDTNWVIFDGVDDILLENVTEVASGFAIGLAKITRLTEDDLRIGFCNPGIDGSTIGNIEGGSSTHSVEIYSRNPTFLSNKKSGAFAVGDVIMVYFQMDPAAQVFSVGKLSEATWTPIRVEDTRTIVTTSHFIVGAEIRSSSFAPIYNTAKYHMIIRCNAAPTASELQSMFDYFKTLNVT